MRDLVRRGRRIGLAYVPADMAQPYRNEVSSRVVLDDCCLPYSGYRLYYHEPAPIVAGICPAWSRRCAIEIETDEWPVM